MGKAIIVLGSTGSIGRQPLDVIRKSGHDFRVRALAAGRGGEAFEAQVREFKPRLVCLWEEEAARDLKLRLEDMAPLKVLWGPDGLETLIRADDAGSGFLGAAGPAF
ncbi:MAG: hypothetical protein IJR95_05530 [Lachnospiraceae bacterium]|nr:hypothetical protein [Lachnospiraceae bacterium]